MRNPKWDRDELILALDLYFKLKDKESSYVKHEIKELSSLLRDIGRKKIGAINSNYRNFSSVQMKLANFRSIDPDYNGKGLESFSNMDQKIWNEFSYDKNKLNSISNLIKQYIELSSFEDPFKYIGITEAVEGRILSYAHISRERNKKLINNKKELELKIKGKLVCEVCEFDFRQVYGEHGNGFIECHHTKPLYTLDGNTKTKLEDLVILCSNCHRMIHHKTPWLSITELKKIFNNGRYSY